LMRTNASHLSGRASSGKIASTGHSGSHAPQSMHSSGSITRMRPNSWMQSTGQTSTHERSLMSMQGSAMMYVTRSILATACGRRPWLLLDELVDELGRPLDERGLDDHLVEAGGMGPLQPGLVGVIRETEDRDLGPRVDDLVRLDARDVADHEIGLVDAVGGDQVVARQERFELASKEE